MSNRSWSTATPRRSRPITTPATGFYFTNPSYAGKRTQYRADVEKPDGVIVQFGGQTPLTLALPLKRLGVPIIGTDPSNIDLAEDRKLFGKLLDELAIPSPANGTATSADQAVEIAKRIGYPVLVRPSYVLGGRAMMIVYDEDSVRRYMREAVTFSQDRPVLVDRFLEDALEVDVDALCDGDEVLIAGIMEHIEEAGVHSGDSSCVLPPVSIPESEIKTIEEYTVKLARALNVIGLMNVQYAIKDGVVYVLEVNPRASRTVPYVSKATGVPLPKLAVQLMLGKKLHEVTEYRGRLPVPLCFVKSPVFPFNKFPGVDPALGPEMRSTGEVMGVGVNFGEAFSKAQLSAGTPLPEKGTVFISVNATNRKLCRSASGSPNLDSTWLPPVEQPRHCKRPASNAGLSSKSMKGVRTRSTYSKPERFSWWFTPQPVRFPSKMRNPSAARRSLTGSRASQR